MNSLVIEKCTLKDLVKIKDIGKRTFYETFFDENLKDNKCFENLLNLKQLSIW